MPYIVILLITLGFNSIFSQNSKNPNSNDLEIYFYKQNITWNWQNYFDYQFSNENYGLEVKDSYLSKLISPSKDINNWRDENNFNGFFYKKISNFQTGIFTKSWVLSDFQTSATNLFSNHNIGIKTNYYPKSNLTITPYTGYQRAQNRSYVDWGWDVGLESEYDKFVLDDYRGSFETALDYDFYPNRQNSNQEFLLNFETKFSPITIDSIYTYYKNSNKIFYDADGDELINVNIEEKYLHNYFEYLYSSKSKLALQTILSSKSLFDDSRSNPTRDVLKFENRLNIYYLLGDLELNFGFDTFQETQNNTGLSTDSDVLQSNIRSNVYYKLSQNDQINMKINLTKYQFDTPDSVLNNDDRDELRIVSGIEFIRKFSPVLNFRLEAYINFFHQVYIFKERSANNNWNRIFRLSSDVEYHSSTFKNILKNEILANYTVYDFEEQFTQSQSFIFRKYILEDSLSFNILPRLKTGINGRYEFEDKGSFFKAEFAQQILQSTESLFIDFFLRFKNIYLLDLDTGVALYTRRDWRHVPIKSIIRDVNTTTPYFRIRYALNEKLIFVTSASYVFSDEMNQKSSSYTTGSLTLVHQF
jgi:hypothetical protein